MDRGFDQQASREKVIQPQAKSMDAINPALSSTQAPQGEVPPAPTGELFGVKIVQVAVPASASVVVSSGEEEVVGEFDAEAWDQARAEVVSASRARGNVHLDQLHMAVESMRGREIFYIHDASERGRITTVTNIGQIWVKWQGGPNKGSEACIHEGDRKDFAVDNFIPVKANPTLTQPEATLRAQEASARAYGYENQAMGFDNLDHLGHGVASHLYEAARAANQAAADLCSPGGSLRPQLVALAIEHARLSELHAHWAKVKDPASMQLARQLHARLVANSDSKVQSLGLPRWREVDIDFLSQIAHLNEAMAPGYRSRWNSTLPRAIENAEKFLSEHVPAMDERNSVLGDRAREMEGRFAEVGLCAMYGGRKGHGFWISETSPEIAKKIHSGDFEAMDAAKAAGEFRTLASAENEAKTGNPFFFGYNDAMVLLAGRIAQAIEVGSVENQVGQAKADALAALDASTEAVNQVVKTRDAGMTESRKAHLASQDAAEASAVSGARAENDKAITAHSLAADAHQKAIWHVTLKVNKDAHRVAMERHQALVVQHVAMTDLL